MYRVYLRALQIALTLGVLLLAFIPKSAFPQGITPKVFIPVVLRAENEVVPRGPGSQKIIDAGMFRWDEEDIDPPVVNQAVPATEENPNTPINNESAGPDGSTLACTTQDWEQTGKLETRTIIALDTDPAVYPGALIQGASLQDGELAQIRGIPRAGGVIYLTNLTLAQDVTPSTGRDPLYTRDVPTISGAAVNEAIKDILTGETLGTAAQFDYSEEVGYSLEQTKFSMGVDGRFPSGSFDADLDINTDNQKSYSYLLFTQIYYDVVFDSWTGPVSLFRDGENFSDTNQEIGPDNPPLYVEKVSYGRQVLFILESDYSASDVKAAMQAAYDGAAADVNFNADLTHRKVMQNTRVKYRVRGGDASAALKAIDSATPDDMFDAVKASLADKATANYSAANPGVPIYYTLRYLSNDRFATMDRAVRYTKRDCTYQQGPGPLQGQEFYIDGFHDRITVNQTWIGDINKAQFGIKVDNSITWWKALEVGDRTVFLETEANQRSQTSRQYSLSEFSGAEIPLSFWKAKGVGVHTFLETKRYGKSDLAGYLTTFTWHND